MPDDIENDDNDPNLNWFLDPELESADPRVPGVGPHNPKGGRPMTERDRQHIAERRLNVERGDLLGMSPREMAEQFNVSRTTIRRDLEAVRAARLEDMSEGIDDERARELARLERLRTRWARAAEHPDAPDPKAADMVLRIADRKAKLLGLDAPRRTEVTGAEGKPLLEGFAIGVDNDTLVELLSRDVPDLDT